MSNGGIPHLGDDVWSTPTISSTEPPRRLSESLWNIVNWDEVNKRLARPMASSSKDHKHAQGQSRSSERLLN